MDFFDLSAADQNKVLQHKIEQLKIDRFKNDLPIVYKTPECFDKPELYIYEYSSGQKELFAFNTQKLRERILLKYS
ncbi:MAG: hypothetical protein EOP34_04470 [Rickettsiales bacterium]|nr:MAG: hypothetical protein EOP34_04470 [Rickettsiales bacterium]